MHLCAEPTPPSAGLPAASACRPCTLPPLHLWIVVQGPRGRAGVGGRLKRPRKPHKRRCWRWCSSQTMQRAGAAVCLTLPGCCVGWESVVLESVRLVRLGGMGVHVSGLVSVGTRTRVCVRAGVRSVPEVARKERRAPTPPSSQPTSPNVQAGAAHHAYRGGVARCGRAAGWGRAL